MCKVDIIEIFKYCLIVMIRLSVMLLLFVSVGISVGFFKGWDEVSKSRVICLKNMFSEIKRFVCKYFFLEVSIF